MHIFLHNLVGGASLVSVLFACRTSLADSPAAPSATTEERTPVPPPMNATSTSTSGHWYDWQTLVADGASIAVGLGTAKATKSNAALENVGPLLFLGGYLLAAPVLHAAHRKAGTAVGSFFMRIGLPVAGCQAFLGGYMVATSSSPDDRSAWDGFAYACGMGMVAGIGAAIAIDAAVLAREHKDAPDPAPAGKMSLRIAPTFGASNNGAVGGIIGVF